MSPKLILYYHTASPPARAVLLTAAALGVELELKEVDLLTRSQLKPEYIKLNAQHTVPLLDDNGLKIVDSHVICGYLVDKYGIDDKLYPKDVAKRTLIDSRLYYEAANVFSRLRCMLDPLLIAKITELPEDKIKYIQETYEVLDRFVSETQYMCGNDLSIADFSLIATVSSIKNFAPIDSAAYPNLINWIERMSQLPYYEEKNGIGSELILQLVNEVLKKNASE